MRLFEEACPKAEEMTAVETDRDVVHQPCASGLSWCNAKHACIDPATTTCPHGADSEGNSDVTAHAPCAAGLSWCNAKQMCIDPAKDRCLHGIMA